MKKLFYTVLAVAAVMASCAKVEPDNVATTPSGPVDLTSNITTIEASTDDATKAYVNPENNTQVLWEEGDKVCAFCYGYINNSRYADVPVAYSLSSGAGKTSGTFVLDLDGQRISSIWVSSLYSIVSPYSAFDMLTGSYAAYDHLIIKIPTVQKARKGSFDKDAAVMYDFSHYYSKNNIDDIHLKYAVNFLKISISESEKVIAVKISSPTPLTGKASIADDEVQPYYTGTENYVVLQSEDGKAMEPGDYYIAVMPGAIEDPVITYKSEHSIKSKAGSSAITFAEGTNVKPIKVDFSKGDVSGAVQLWKDGPYWSVKNIGAETPYDPGYYFSWGNTTGYVRNSNNDGWMVAPGYPNAGNTLNGGFSGDNYTKSPGYSLKRDLQANATEDAAVAAWGSDWRMPTKDEVDKFSGNVSSALSNDYKYYTIKGEGDYSCDYIVFPVTLTALEDRISGNYYSSNCWTSTFSKNSAGSSMPYGMVNTFNFSVNSEIPHTSNYFATYGMNIRPVLVNTNF